MELRDIMIEIQFMPRFEKVLNSLLRMSNIDVVTDDGRVQRNGGISVQMKTFIDRTYPIWQHLGKKEVYYIISAGLGEDIIERSLGDLNGFVEHLEEYKIAGKIYATNVMDAGLVKNQSVFQKAYDMGYAI